MSAPLPFKVPVLNGGESDHLNGLQRREYSMSSTTIIWIAVITILLFSILGAAAWRINRGRPKARTRLTGSTVMAMEAGIFEAGWRQRWHQQRQTGSREARWTALNNSVTAYEGSGLERGTNEYMPGAEAGAVPERQESKRSIATLPPYREAAMADERVLGRAGDRDGIDTVIELVTAEDEERMRNLEMEQLYQMRQLRRDWNAQRAIRREQRRNARVRIAGLTVASGSAQPTSSSEPSSSSSLSFSSAPLPVATTSRSFFGLRRARHPQGHQGRLLQQLQHEEAALRAAAAQERARTGRELDALRLALEGYQHERKGMVNIVDYKDVGITRHDGSRVKTTGPSTGECVGLLAANADAAADSHTSTPLASPSPSPSPPPTVVDLEAPPAIHQSHSSAATAPGSLRRSRAYGRGYASARTRSFCYAGKRVASFTEGQKTARAPPLSSSSHDTVSVACSSIKKLSPASSTTSLFRSARQRSDSGSSQHLFTSETALLSQQEGGRDDMLVSDDGEVDSSLVGDATRGTSSRLGDTTTDTDGIPRLPSIKFDSLELEVLGFPRVVASPPGVSK